MAPDLMNFGVVKWIDLWYPNSRMASSEAAPIFSQTSPEDARFHKFTSTTVHHMREPVRMVVAYSEMLQSAYSGELSSEALQAVEFLQKAAHQMQTLLDGMSELLTATSQTVRPQSPLRLELPLRQALVQLDPDLKAAGAEVTYVDLPTVPVDFDRFELVFRHLIKNAVQYRGQHAPRISISASRAAHEWVIQVQDNGTGIAPEFSERIFDLYSRLHGKSLPGSGLGLAICRAIVEGHGGKIWVESNAAEGSSFFFTLPAQGVTR